MSEPDVYSIPGLLTRRLILLDKRIVSAVRGTLLYFIYSSAKVAVASYFTYRILRPSSAPVNSGGWSLLGLLRAVISKPLSAMLHLLRAGNTMFVTPFTSYIMYLRSRYLWFMMKGVNLTAQQMRNHFSDMPFTAVSNPQNHSHPIAAADRNRAGNFADRFSAKVGLDSYFIQQSRSDERAHRSGNRVFYWTKDMNVQPKPFRLPSNPLMVLVDVDQYIDMPEFLVSNYHPTLIYTFQPSAVSRISSNYNFTFVDENTVKYRVTGGGGFTHQVWNYSTDHIYACKKFCGIPYSAAAYGVDRRYSSEDHELILLTPVAKWTGISAILAWNWLYGRGLERLVVNDRGFNRLYVSSLEDLVVSTGRIGGYACANVSADIDDTISSIARTGKHDISLPTVLGFVEGDKVAAAALLEYHLDKNIGTKVSTVCPVEQAVRRYQFNPYHFENDAKPSLVAFMNPLVNGAFAPDMTRGNEEQMIKGRIDSVKSTNIQVGTYLSKIMLEFAELIIPDNLKHTFDPVDYNTVLTKQNRPTQRRILHDTEAMDPLRVIKSFAKKEAYANVKDPRIISTINGVDKREYSMYMYAMSLLFKEKKWYAFSKVPWEIARRVADVCSGASMVANTDYSRFDGHGSNVMRELEQIVMMRAFRIQYHEQLLQLHRSQFGLKAVATYGTWYETGFSRASGSPETSLFNTVVNAFIAYLALRSTKVQGVYLDPVEAYARLGIYGGDDGLTADIEPPIYRRAAASVGQDLTIEPVLSGESGVKFLARIYSPNVWYGDINSCCDIPRTLAKLHVTVRLAVNVSPAEKLVEKARCLALSDLNTPVVGDFAAAVMRVHIVPIEPNEKTIQMRTWLSRFDAESQYPNDDPAWMLEYFYKVMPDFDYKKFLAWIETADTYAKLLSPPMFMPQPIAESKEQVAVDGDIIIPQGQHLQDRSRKKTVVKAVKPDSVTVPTKQEGKPFAGRHSGETFEQMVDRKKRNGTWIDKPNPPSGGKDNGSGLDRKHSDRAVSPKGRKPQRTKIYRPVRNAVSPTDQSHGQGGNPAQGPPRKF